MTINRTFAKHSIQLDAIDALVGSIEEEIIGLFRQARQEYIEREADTTLTDTDRMLIEESRGIREEYDICRSDAGKVNTWIRAMLLPLNLIQSSLEKEPYNINFQRNVIRHRKTSDTFVVRMLLYKDKEIFHSFLAHLFPKDLSINGPGQVLSIIDGVQDIVSKSCPLVSHLAVKEIQSHIDPLPEDKWKGVKILLEDKQECFPLLIRIHDFHANAAYALAERYEDNAIFLKHAIRHWLLEDMLDKQEIGKVISTCVKNAKSLYRNAPKPFVHT